MCDNVPRGMEKIHVDTQLDEITLFTEYNGKNPIVEGQ